VHPQVDPVEHRAGETAAIALDGVRKARALGGRVARVAARAGVHRGDQDEPRRVGRGAARSGDRDLAFLERLAQRFQDLALVLRDFIDGLRVENLLRREAGLSGRPKSPT